jgi:transcriptional regulator with XRE-family HTH domain
MDREDYRHHFEMLELTTTAGPADIKKAYLELKDIYSQDSQAIISMPDEISSEQKKDILRQIEESYRILSEMFSCERNAADELVDRIVADITDFKGATLKEIRHKLNISLEEVAKETRVQYGHLVNIEKDNFAKLPARVYTRGFVMMYAKFLSLDPEAVAKSYMENFERYHENGNGAESSQLVKLIKGIKSLYLTRVKF